MMAVAGPTSPSSGSEDMPVLGLGPQAIPVSQPEPRASTGSARPERVEGRKRTLDNPRVIGLAVGLLIAILAGLVWLSERTGTGEIVSPLLSDAILYVLYAVDLTILAALVFVLVRNLLKVW